MWLTSRPRRVESGQGVSPSLLGGAGANFKKMEMVRFDEFVALFLTSSEDVNVTRAAKVIRFLSNLVSDFVNSVYV